MKFSTKISAALLVLVMAFALTACGNNSAEVDKTDAVSVLTASQKAMEDVKSMDGAIMLDFEMVINDQTLPMTMEGTYSAFSEPVKMHMDTNMVMGLGSVGAEDTNINMTIYGEEKDGKLNIYMNDGSQWTKATEPLDSSQYNMNENMALYLDSSSSAQVAGNETIDGKDCIKIDAVISGENLSKVMAASGMEENLNTLGMGELSGIFSNLGDLPVVIWVDSENFYPVQYSMDMKQMMDAMMSQLMGAIGQQAEMENINMSINKYNMTMKCDSYNQSAEIEIPAEALNAPDITDAMNNAFDDAANDASGDAAQ